MLTSASPNAKVLSSTWDQTAQVCTTLRQTDTRKNQSAQVTPMLCMCMHSALEHPFTCELAGWYRLPNVPHDNSPILGEIECLLAGEVQAIKHTRSHVARDLPERLRGSRQQRRGGRQQTTPCQCVLQGEPEEQT